MEGSKIQQYFWGLANHDVFLMQYCPTLYNKVAGIGVFFLFQIFIIFTTILTAYGVFVGLYPVVGWLIAGIATYSFYRWLKVVATIPFIAQCIINLAFALLLSLPYCLALFEQQVLFHLYMKAGYMNIGLPEQLWLKPYALYQSSLEENEGNIIIFASLAVFTLVLFIFIVPYLLLYQNRKSTYYLLKKNYEDNFKEKT